MGEYVIALKAALLGLVVTASQCNATEYWVGKSGSDSNGCTNATSDACLTIQKGVSLLAPGDVLNVGAGIYTDDGGSSLFKPTGTYCGWQDGQPPSSNVCLNLTGTSVKPITIQAVPGDEGQVVIDGENSRVAIHIGHSDYVSIKGFIIRNASCNAIISWGQHKNAVADEARLSIGVRIENNKIEDVIGQPRRNCAAIGMWGSRDWVVRNNRIHNVTADGSTNRTSGIQSYGVINALIEHNEITEVGSGVFWKDHFVADDKTRKSIFESEIRYNKISASERPIHISISGGGSEEAGENYIHHNVAYGFSDGNAGIHVGMSGAHSISAPIRIEHNLVDGEGKSANGISVDSSEALTIRGNIFMRTAVDIELIAYSFQKVPKLIYSDFNIFDSTFKVDIDLYSQNGGGRGIESLAAWKAERSGEYISLLADNPDTHSLSANYQRYVVDAANHDYRSLPNSPAIGLMPDGSNAGPWQQGNETIGLTQEWPGDAP